MTTNNNNNTTNPLCSCIITLYTLILLYFPQFALSPVLLLTLIILLSLLRLGANQNSHFPKDQNTLDPIEAEEETDELQQTNKWVMSESELGSISEVGFVKDRDFDTRFVEWDVRAPLRVIYEEEEEEEYDYYYDEETKKEKDPTRIERYPSLSLYYPETDSDSDGSGEFEMGFPFPMIRWEEDHEDNYNKEGLIEITLDDNNNNYYYNNNIEKFHFEDDQNLIEIDISQINSFLEINSNR
ncbi:hypothetical protein ACFE04_020591 [Oxalis oulophora]